MAFNSIFVTVQNLSEILKWFTWLTALSKSFSIFVFISPIIYKPTSHDLSNCFRFAKNMDILVFYLYSYIVLLNIIDLFVRVTRVMLAYYRSDCKLYFKFLSSREMTVCAQYVCLNCLNMLEFKLLQYLNIYCNTFACIMFHTCMSNKASICR